MDRRTHGAAARPNSHSLRLVTLRFVTLRFVTLRLVTLRLLNEIPMRVYATAATGYVGSAVVRELLGTGHQVLRLARSDAAAAALIAAGAAVHRGDLSDLDSLRNGAATADGVIHTAFNNFSETTDMAASVQADLRAVETIGTALEGSGKPFVVTSATFLLARLGRLGTEEDVSDSAVPRAAP